MAGSGQIDSKVLGQRIGITVVMAAVFYTLMSGTSGTFEHQSKAKPKSAWSADSGDDDSDDGGWGSGTRGARTSDSAAAARARLEAQRAERISGAGKGDVPVYDAGRDGGWGGD